jgi:hypothetical protein
MWWIYIVVVVVMALAVYGFISLAGFETRWLTSKTSRRAEDMYDRFSDSPRKRNRKA